MKQTLRTYNILTADGKQPVVTLEQERDFYSVRVRGVAGAALQSRELAELRFEEARAREIALRQRVNESG